MPLVFAGICSHAPSITGRANLADPEQWERFYSAFERMKIALETANSDALVVVAAEYFGNFFMNNMPPLRWVWRITMRDRLRTRTG
mgnify:CR=1 FL=1|jgi:2,3-dihydroxyphenylpropionate 1,2-dioxygenase